MTRSESRNSVSTSDQQNEASRASARRSTRLSVRPSLRDNIYIAQKWMLEKNPAMNKEEFNGHFGIPEEMDYIE